jgi:hypothetical protein
MHPELVETKGLVKGRFLAIRDRDEKMYFFRRA